MTEATKATAASGFLESYGIPTGDPTQMLKQRRASQVRNASTGADGQLDGMQMVGASLAGLLMPNKLSAQEQAQYDIKKDADKIFNDAKGHPDYQKMNEEDKLFLYQKSVAQATSKSNPSLASEMVLQTNADRADYRKQQQELRKLDLTNEGLEQTNTNKGLDETIKRGTISDAITARDRKEAGEFSDYAVRRTPEEGGGFDMSQTRSLQQGTDGRYYDADGKEHKNPMPWSNALQLQDKNQKALSTADVDSWKELSLLQREEAFRKHSKEEIKNSKVVLNSTLNSVETVNRIGKSLQKSLDSGVSLESYLGLAGTASAFVNDMVAAVGGGRDTMEKMTLIDENDNAVADYADLKGADSASRQVLRDLGVENAELQANIIDLAFATARIYDPTARSLSDQDYQIALKRIGGSYNDPSALVATLQQLSMKATSTYGNIVDGIKGDAESFELPGERGVKIVFGKNHGKLVNMMADTQDIYLKLADQIRAGNQAEVDAAAGGSEEQIFLQGGGGVPTGPASTGQPSQTSQIPAPVGAPTDLEIPNVIEYGNGGSIQFN